MSQRIKMAASALSVVAALGAFVAQPVLAQEIKIGMQGEPGTMDPQFNLLGTNTSALRNIYDTLSSRDQNLQLVPSLALSWRVVDETTWEYKLRPNVKFHDGSPFTAADVKFTIERVPNVPGNPNSYLVYVNQIKQVHVIDPLTVHFKTDGPAPLLPTNLSNIFIISSAKGVQSPADFNSGKAAIGTGPYKFSSWQPGSPFVLERNEQYWGAKPDWAKVTFMPITRDASRVAALLSGAVDFINVVPIADLENLSKDKRFKVFAGNSAYTYMMFPDVGRDDPPGVTDETGKPVTKNPFKDARVREAFSIGMNRPGIVERIMEGRATVANQVLPKGFFGRAEKLAMPAYDADKARKLLADAGYGKGFGVQLACPNDRFINDAKICEAVAQNLARLNIKVELQSQPRAVFFPARAKNAFGLHMAGWGSLTGEGIYFLQAQVHTPNKELGLGAINTNGVGEPDIDQLIQRARRTLDDKQRDALIQDAMTKTFERNLIIPALTFQTIWAGRADKVDFKTRADEETLAIEIKRVGS